MCKFHEMFKCAWQDFYSLKLENSSSINFWKKRAFYEHLVIFFLHSSAGRKLKKFKKVPLAYSNDETTLDWMTAV